MKIGIITQPLHNNYGGILQNYALQQALILLGHGPITIDWKSSKVSPIKAQAYAIKQWILRNILCKKNVYTPKYLPNEEEIRIISRNNIEFIDKYINRTSIVDSLEGFLSETKNRNLRALIVGSDQVWRPSYACGRLSEMFLSFAESIDIKRLSYAASFGTDKWEFTPEETSECARLAQKFFFVSVREDSGIKLCEKYLGVKAKLVLDPTMLLTKEDYLGLLNDGNIPNSNGNLFHYILDPEPSKSVFINRIAVGMNLTPFLVLPKCQAENRTKRDIKERIEDCVFPGVLAWLRAFADAEMVVVDSFHGMVFSIIFNKPFWVIGNFDRGMSRFTSLLKIFGLEDRLLDVSQIDKIDYTKPINWNIINSILQIKREECKNLLSKALT